MENQHIICRPNSFTSEEWELLSREQQIAWWKSREPVQEPPPRGPRDHLASFKRGEITIRDLHGSIFKSLTEQNLTDLDRFPLDLLLSLATAAAELPTDEDETGWSEIIHISGACYAPWVTPQDIQRIEELQRKRFREGVRMFRTHYPNVR